MNQVFKLSILFFLLSAFTVGDKKLTPYIFENHRYFPSIPQPLSNPVTYEGVELGRYLFYDPILSRDSTISCASCHRQEVAFSDSPNKYSKGVNDSISKRNTLPLFNLAFYEKLFWDGRSNSIENQVLHPVRLKNEMNLEWKEVSIRIQKSKFYKPKFKAIFGHTEIDSIHISNVIAQFERTLISNNSKYDKALRREVFFTKNELHGFELANDQSMGDCFQCHPTDGNSLATTLKFSNNGIENYKSIEEYYDKGVGGITGNKKEIGMFKIPSLRNIALTSPYMHDGRFSTLEEVLDFYSEHVNTPINIDSKMQHAYKRGVHLNEKEKEDIIAFLHTLTDSSFITNPEFSNPFTK